MKLVINKCYGGFGLSGEATKRIAARKGKECYFFKSDGFRGKLSPADPSKEKGFSAMILQVFDVPDPMSLSDKDRNDHSIYYSRLERNDPDLIAVVEDMGDAASGPCADLRIVEIPDDIAWVIEEYDGRESVEEAHRTLA